MALPAGLLKAKNALAKAKAAGDVKSALKNKSESAKEKFDSLSTENKVGLTIAGCSIPFIGFLIFIVILVSFPLTLFNIFAATNDTKASAATTTGSVDYNYNGTVTELMEKVVATARDQAGAAGYNQLCEMWVEVVWQNATGIQRDNRISAWHGWESWGVSSDRDNIPPGAAVYASGWPYGGSATNNQYGHVGIYLGNGEVADYMRVWNIDDWINQQYANCNGHVGWLGWGWVNGIDLTTR